ncbi:hypothetical protein N7513_010518 [Penicillium frequentans]|nr:hypothetical protein N7513_010518 [Penicillium glabrum]
MEAWLSCGASKTSKDLQSSTHGLPASPHYQKSAHRAKNDVPRQSLRALVQLHVVQQYVGGVTVRVCDGGAARHPGPIIFAQRSNCMTMNHTHERGQMQDPSSAGVKDQLNEDGSGPVQTPSGQCIKRERENPILWPVSLGAGGTNNRASVTRLLPPG